MKNRTSTLSAAKCIAAVFVVLVGLAHPVSAATWTDVYYELGVQNSQSGNTYISPAHITDNSGQAVGTTQSIGSKATITVFASPGVLKTGVWNIAEVQSLSLTGVSDYSFSTTQASFFDQITINPANPALVGQTGMVNGYFLLSGGISAIWNLLNNNSPYFDVYARGILQVSGTGIPGFIQAQENHGNSGGSLTNVSIPAPTVIPVSFATTFGNVTGIQYNMNLQGYSSASIGFRECGGGYGPCGAIASADLDADYSHSLLWGGINSITDASGNLIDFTITSSSGFDYANPVPIPAAVWLFGSGVAGLLAVSRRKK